MISTRTFFVVLVLSIVSATVYEESTGWCRPPDYVGGVELLWTLDQCRNYCDNVPTCTGFHFTNLMGPQHATVHQRCWPFSASRGCNQQEKQAEIQRYRDLKLNCCLDLSCPNKQYLSGAVGASKYNWICGRTFTRKHPRTQTPTTQPTALPTLNPTVSPTVTNVLAPPGGLYVFCNGGTGMKELSRYPDLGSCYNAANADSDCDITLGVAYATQANDPTDTWRPDRCLCVRKTCNGPWHATDLAFARYGDPYLAPFFEYTQYLNLDGVSDRVDVSNNFNTIQGGEMTFAFRATQKSIVRNYERAWDWSGSCGQRTHVFADVYTSLRMTFQVYGLGTVTVDNFWELGVEHVYAFVVSNTHMIVYRDGIQMGALAVNGGISNSVRDQFYIGGSSCDCDQHACGSRVHRWHANVNWFRVWTEALTETRIRDLNTLRTPTVQPTALPTLNPTSNPSLNPTSNPSLSPSSNPSLNPSSSPTLTPTTNPSKRPTAEDFVVKVKGFHGQPKDILDSSKLQDQPEVDAEFFGFEQKLTPLTRRLLNRVYDVQEQGSGREDDLDMEEQLLQLLSETTGKDLAVKKSENLPEF